MGTPISIIILGLFIFWGHYLNGVFERKSIPDVLGLMFIGLLIGPILHIVDPASFSQFGSLFSNLVLIFILFESGTDLNLSEVKSSFADSARVTAIGFFSTFLVSSVFCFFMIHLPLLASLFIGATIGGTSSAVVVGLVKKLHVQPKTATTLIMESAETDVFTLAIPLAILGLMTTGDLSANIVISQFISSLVLALFIGISGAFLWSHIVNRFTTLKSTKFSTPAFLFILYGITEYLNFSGPLTALSFGIAIGNLSYLEPKFIDRIAPDQNIILPQGEKEFFSELVFLLRTFFFVYIGLSIRIDRMDLLLLGGALTLALFLTRLVMIKWIISPKTPLIDKAAFSFMIPKGLGAAVIATLPLQNGILEGQMIQSVCFAVILFSTIFCVLLFFMLKREISLPFYRLVFGKD